MSSQNAAAAIVNTGGTPDNLKQWSDKNNAHWHDYDAVLLINRTGGGLVAGDVVRLSTGNASSAVTADSVASHRPFVVAMATIADTAAGEFARAGLVSAKSTGTINLGEYVRKSATSKAIETTSVVQGNTAAIPDGTIGVAVAASAGGFTLILLWSNQSKTNNLLISSGTDQAIQNTTTETDITGSVASILAGTLQAAGGVVTVEIAGVLNGWDSASVPDATATFRLKYGATTVVSIAVTVYKATSVGTLVNEPFELIAQLSGHGVTNDQRGFLRYHGRQQPGAAPLEVTPVVRRGSAAEDSTATKTFKVTGQLNVANTSNYILIERVRVVMPPT